MFVTIIANVNSGFVTHQSSFSLIPPPPPGRKTKTRNEIDSPISSARKRRRRRREEEGGGEGEGEGKELGIQCTYGCSSSSDLIFGGELNEIVEK